MTNHWSRPLDAVLARGTGFGHREHLELAWSYLGALPLDAAEDAMEQAIRHVAGAHGVPDRFHATLTRGWLRLVAHHRARSAGTSFSTFIAENEGLLDRKLLTRHYSSALLNSDDARREYVPPDLRALPLIADVSRPARDDPSPPPGA